MINAYLRKVIYKSWNSLLNSDISYENIQIQTIKNEFYRKITKYNSSLFIKKIIIKTNRLLKQNIQRIKVSLN